MRGFACFLNGLFVCLALLTPPAMAQGEPPTGFDPSHTQAAASYMCPMHPHIHGKAGDKCPICGMDLVPSPSDSGAEKKAPKATSAPHAHPAGRAEISIDPTYVQALGVRTAPVLRRSLADQIRAFGQIVPLAASEYRVAVRTAGLIRDLKIDSVGRRVEKGDLLFTLYSPDLVVAQQDYLSRTAAGPHRLRMLGMDDKAIAQLDRERKILYETPFHAPATGVVASLEGRKGQSVSDGATILEIHDLSRVWVDAALPEKDVRRIKTGQTALIDSRTFPTPRPGKVEIVAPEMDEITRTASVKILLDNTDDTLRPGQYVDVVFETSAEARLSVPAEAVLYGGQGARVVRALGDGRFEVVAVQTGQTGQGYVEILSGLAEGQTVVLSGQFLIDAESSLRGGTDRMLSDKSGPAQDLNPQHGGAHVH